jgi:hypothetical protein
LLKSPVIPDRQPLGTDSGYISKPRFSYTAIKIIALQLSLAPNLPIDGSKKYNSAADLSMGRDGKRMIHPASSMNQHKKYHIRPAPLMGRAGKCMVCTKGNKKGRRLLLSPLLFTDLP